MTRQRVSLDGQIAVFEAMSRDELRDRFRKAFQVPPPAYLSREFLIRALSHRFQEGASGDPHRALAKRLQTMAATLRETDTIDVGHTPPVKPGTRLIREWKGRTHEVIVTEAGFIYRDERYQSLSQIARLITDARWSGPRFFGLTKRKQPAGNRHAA